MELEGRVHLPLELFSRHSYPAGILYGGLIPPVSHAVALDGCHCFCYAAVL